MRLLSACVAVLGLAISPAAAGQGAQDPEDAGLLVSSGTFGSTSYASIFVSTSGLVARVEIAVPQGYSLDLARPAGTEIGSVVALLGEPGGDLGSFADGVLTTESPSAYATDAEAQACAPGAHAAVWKATLSSRGRSFALPIFVGPAGAGDPSGVAYVLRACPVWRSTEVGVAHRVARFLDVTVEGASIRIPSTPAHYTWSALVTPTAAGSIEPSPSQAFEVRATIAVPRVLTLRAKHDPKAKSVLLTGRLTSLGRPEAGVEVEVHAARQGSVSFGDDPSVRTDANGEFRLRRPVRVTTQFTATVDAAPRVCTAQSSAPRGCVSETLSPPVPATAFVAIRLKTDPKLTERKRDKALARAVSLKASDFPQGWDGYTSPLPVDLCPRFRPDLSALTATGEATSPVFLTDSTAAASATTVYADAGQARTAFRKEAQLAAARCIADDARAGGSTVVHSVGPLAFPRLADELRAFRVALEDDEGAGQIDLISFRKGRVVVHMFVVAVGGPLDALERELVANLLARARGG